MKKTIKISLIMIILIMFFVTISYGFGINNVTGNQANTGDLIKHGNTIFNVVSTIGVVVSVVVLIALGIKYMFSGVEEKAEYKKTLMPYVIGAGFVFCASTIAQIVYELAKTI